MKPLTVLAFFAIMLTLLACQEKSANFSSEQSGTAKSENEVFSPPMNEISADSEENIDEKEQDQQPGKRPIYSQPAANPDWDRSIIRTANMETEVKDLKTFTSSVRTLIRQLGGYVDAEEFTIDDYRKNATITLKVPVQKFEEAVNNLSEHSVAVNKISISSQDVSAEIVDIKARLEVRSATRDRYIQLMKGAKNVEDLLRVQSEVNSIQEEIESGKSRANYLAHASAMSTINITCYQLLKPAPIVEEKSENRIMNAFLTGWSIMSSVLLGLLSIWPLLLLIILLYLIFRKK
jgi:hypothetical protein